jgi:N-acetylglucosaminyldiphosphoundecaprenol N-acetyl-beta-D-mannosaminyltransferase
VTALAADPGSRINLLGCEIDALDMSGTLARCEELIAAPGYDQHVAINVAKLVKLKDDPGLRAIIDSCALVNADGQGVVWASRLLGTPLPERVAGIDLMMELLALAEQRGYRVFVLGARREVLECAMDVIRERHPRLELTGRNGYFSAQEEPAVCEEIRAAGADILFVAMSTPRKEHFLADRGPELGVPFAMGVGGAIDVVAGLTRRAPVLWQRLGLEWLFRLLQEPKRMFRRYAETNAAFAVLLGRALLARATHALRRR